MPANSAQPLFLTLLPLLGILLTAALVLIFDLARRKSGARGLGWLAAGGLLATLVASVVWARPSAQEMNFALGGMIRQDWLAFVFQMAFLAGAAVTALFAMDSEGIGRRGEFYLLLLASTLGMCLMAAASDLILLFLAIETTSIPLYALAGFLVRDYKSTESGFKYFLFGATTSAVMLYGLSLFYGFAGTTQFYLLIQGLLGTQVPPFAVIGILLLVLVGFAFKVSAVPFHFWAPDVYEGAPTPVAGFLSTASKAAGFAVLLRFVLALFPAGLLRANFPQVIIALAIIATLTMILGNVLALTQKNIKRLLAYSSIGQAGYMLIGVAVGTPLGAVAAVFYLVTYLATNLAAFGVVTIAGRALGTDDISGYAGLSRRSPGLALALLASFLSLAGIPVFGGFVAKVLVFSAAVQADLVWLAVVGVVNSVIGLYYYLSVLKVAYLYRSQEEDRPVQISRPWAIALTVCVAGLIAAGTLFAPLFNWSELAGLGLF